jgi:hypothetical protein
MEVFGIEELSLTILDPLGSGQGLALWAMAIATANGELTISCLMGSFF